ncbi:hypothetical protein [Streptomyces sp. NPDC029003]|uniref:hypothetical protein n=1 Tax=Streptomyces sp. NPDC029003 TaxID=3155125 RepID=UPI003409B094
MSWASWTTRGVFAGRAGVRTGEGGPVLTGELDVHTTWIEATGLAQVTVQYSGASEWFPLAESPIPCTGEAESRALHDLVIASIRAGTPLLLGPTAPTAGPPA